VFWGTVLRDTALWDAAFCDKGPVCGLGEGASHGYPARQERVDYANGYPPALAQE